MRLAPSSLGAGGSFFTSSSKYSLASQLATRNYDSWLSQNIYAYVALSAPLLGAVNPLRAVVSGETMGLPVNEDVARDIEVSFIQVAVHWFHPLLK
tara:strand:- start:62 stop:349 length:288 start_codon:yes stop_codon:yes gene_type:complete